MESYLQPTINMKPDGIVFMFGMNKLRTDSSKQIAENIIKLAKSIASQFEHVAVSGIVMRADSFILRERR